MHTLIACWQLPTSSEVIGNESLPVAMESLKSWGIPFEGWSSHQILFAYATKKRQFEEMNRQFKEGEQADEGVGLMRTGKDMQDRAGSWPPWLFDILSKKMSYDPINKQFFFKHPDDKKLMSLNVWLHKVKSHPVKPFVLKYPATLLRNLFRLTPLKLKLLEDTKYLQIAAVDQPEKGEDGYYHFHDNSFWEGEGHD